MPKRVPLSVSLTPELVAFVTAKVNSGRYGSASEVVRTSLRLLEEKEPHSPASPLAVTQGGIVSHER
ncbi:MAG: type II toxin-antitoxin system ParD family antitoxin [Janthinobacterium lividum]